MIQWFQFWAYGQNNWKQSPEHTHGHNSITHNATQVSTKWANKAWYICEAIYYLTLERKRILARNATWVNVEDIMLWKTINPFTKKVNTIKFYLYRSLEQSDLQTESRMAVAKGWEEGRIRNYFWMSAEIQICKTKNSEDGQWW